MGGGSVKGYQGVGVFEGLGFLRGLDRSTLILIKARRKSLNLDQKSGSS